VPDFSGREVFGMRVLLLQAPVSIRSPHSKLSPPLGLAYVAQYLIDRGHSIELLDLNVTGFNPDRIKSRLKRMRPDLVGVSSHTETYPNALAIAEIVKEHDPAVAILFGGPHASILPQEVLAHPAVDYVAIGEGEQTAAELVQALEGGARRDALAAIAGLGYKADGEARINPAREPLDAADIGRPARHLFSLEFYEDAHNVLTSRGGCPYRCPFCSASQMWGGRRRMRPVEHIINEIRELVQDYGAERVFFVDDILTLNARWLDRLMDAIEDSGLAISWGCATRVDRVSPQMLHRMAQTGCTAIQFGIESGSQEVLDSVKGIRTEDALEAVRAAVAEGINVACSFMVPFPEDDEETLAQSFAFMREVQAAGGRLLISMTTPFPGTMYYERADSLGVRILSDDWRMFDCKHVVMETRHLTAERIESLTETMAGDLGLSKTA
jgi:radical SAM superfamily enzyme YgiQ (UPF0313 family)